MDLQATQQQRIARLDDYYKAYRRITSLVTVPSDGTQTSTASDAQTPMLVELGVQMALVMGDILTEEQYLWFSEETNLAGIPRFLSSMEGQVFLRSFFASYKQFKEPK